jgi:hypothetical protein
MASELTTDELFFNDLVVNAELVSIIAILKEVCHKAGITGPDGISMEDWFVLQKKIELERLFGLLQEKDPDFAARLHERYCRARRC